MVLFIFLLSWINFVLRNKRFRLVSIYLIVLYVVDRLILLKKVSIYFDIWNVLEFKIIVYLYLKYLSNLI